MGSNSDGPPGLFPGYPVILQLPDIVSIGSSHLRHHVASSHLDSFIHLNRSSRHLPRLGVS